jgi:hypothetical protein
MDLLDVTWIKIYATSPGRKLARLTQPIAGHGGMGLTSQLLSRVK